MSFTAEQIAQLEAPLSKAHVKTNPRGFDYVEAYHAENEANRIFGFDAWDRFTNLTLIAETVVGDKHRVYYRATVRILVRTPGGGEVIREGCGFGSGIDKDIGQAHESALKEAESDAEKRALKTFGNPFGQALYDKAQTNVAEVPPRPPAAVELAIQFLRGCKTAAEFKETWEKNYQGWKDVMSDADYRRVQTVKVEMVAKLTPKTTTGANLPPKTDFGLKGDDVPVFQ